jgi:PAS domain S-box-containing protein
MKSFIDELPVDSESRFSSKILVSPVVLVGPDETSFVLAADKPIPPIDGDYSIDRPYACMMIPDSESDDILAETHTRGELFERVERAKREWESTIDALPDLVGLVDELGRIIRANRVVETWGLTQVERVRGRGLHDLLHPDCQDPLCYLAAFEQQVIEQVLRGDSIEHEAYDRTLNRYLHLSARPEPARRQTAVVVIRDVTELKRIEKERERLIEELAAYAHTVAHDLNNPIGLLISYTELLEQGLSATAEDEIRDILQRILQTGHKLHSIVTELLLLAEVRDHDIDMQPIDMSTMVADVLERLKNLLHKYSAEISVPTEWPAVLGHAPWIEEVWANYLNNALKYGGRPAHIEIGSDRLPDGYVRFWVRDNGDGVPLERQSQMFAPFTRLNQRHATGHGLGLSIVRRIVEKLGGQVGVESDGLPGHGSVFFFTLMAG